MSDNSVNVTGFTAEPPELRDAMERACSRVIESGVWVLGPEVEAFESAFATSNDARCCVGVANGLDAIEIILRARSIGPGDEVITSPMTAAASVIAILRAGATPVLADIDPRTALLDPQSVQRCVTPRTRALLLVHLYGQIKNMREWEMLCKQLGIDLIEDCAQSHGAIWNGRHAGTIGIAGAYSFYPTKNLGAVGDAGAIITNDAAVAEAARMLRNYGQRARYEHLEVGMNSRLDEMQAALLQTRLPWLSTFTDRRRTIADAYRTSLSNSRVQLLDPPDATEQHVYHQFVVSVQDRIAFMDHLAGHGIPTLIHYPTALHQQPAFEGISHDPDGLSAAERHAATCVSLPCHPQLTDGEVERIVNAVESFSG